MQKSERRRPRKGQLGLDLHVKPRGHGGWRPGAGRKAGEGRRPAPHRARPEHNLRHPVHVTLRVARDVKSLREERRYGVVRDALYAGANRGADFRLVEYSIQGNHLHCICEAADKPSLANGIRAITIRIARAINRHDQRGGAVFPERYHARALTSPRAVRNCLVYVLHNFKRHAKPSGRPYEASRTDTKSSASWFQGFACRLNNQLLGPRPVPVAQTWLLKTGWRRGAPLIHPREIPRASG